MDNLNRCQICSKEVDVNNGGCVLMEDEKNEKNRN